jgi:3',5'-nucleoside bisphosphate phosphatase
VIDLHLHTTASDGRSTPPQLVAEAISAGLSTIAVTDHDTTAGIAEVEEAAAAHRLTVVPGIEITSLVGGRDVHILAYFVDASNDELAAFLARQREERRHRFVQMLDAIERLGLAIDQESLRAQARAAAGRSLGRPILANALVLAGHVRSTDEAFDRWLGEGRPAFAPRQGALPSTVIDLVRRAGGLTSLAHPGKLKDEGLVAHVIDSGAAAIEVHHPDHDDIDTKRYRQLARSSRLLVTGGSDYHGVGSGRAAGLGRVTLPVEDFAALTARVDRA